MLVAFRVGCLGGFELSIWGVLVHSGLVLWCLVLVRVVFLRTLVFSECLVDGGFSGIWVILAVWV